MTKLVPPKCDWEDNGLNNVCETKKVELNFPRAACIFFLKPKKVKKYHAFSKSQIRGSAKKVTSNELETLRAQGQGHLWPLGWLLSLNEVSLSQESLFSEPKCGRIETYISTERLDDLPKIQCFYKLHQKMYQDNKDVQLKAVATTRETGFLVVMLDVPIDVVP